MTAGFRFVRFFSLFLAIPIGLAFATAASAVSLATLIAGGAVASGGLLFSDFEVQINGDLSTNLANYDVAFDGDGFRLTGPLSGADGEVGDLFLAYNVTAAGSENVVGATLLANNVASGAGAQASVDVVLTEAGSSLAVLSTFDTGGLPGDAVVLAAETFGPSMGFRATTTVLIDSSLVGPDLGGSARISAIEQQYVLTPEADTAALLAIGLAGLAAAGRQRRGPAVAHAPGAGSSASS